MKKVSRRANRSSTENGTMSPATVPSEEDWYKKLYHMLLGASRLPSF